MADSCGATQINIEPEKQKELEKQFADYLDRYCKARNKTADEAMKDVMVQCVYEDMKGWKRAREKMIKKFVESKLLKKYPCDVFLHNALRFIIQNEPKAAYSEICWAIVKSGGELSDEENKFWQTAKRLDEGEGSMDSNSVGSHSRIIFY